VDALSRPHIGVAVPALALRRAQAAAALGVSLETFDAHVRPHVDAVHVGRVTVYPVVELRRFLLSAEHYDGSIDKSGAARMRPPAPWPNRR
jgi:hypothetical protein